MRAVGAARGGGGRGEGEADAFRAARNLNVFPCLSVWKSRVFEV